MALHIRAAGHERPHRDNFGRIFDRYERYPPMTGRISPVM
jgi:hypothetical protein